jgi:transcriptional regulator
MPTADTGIEVLRGSLDVLILKALSFGPAHGYTVSRWIRSVTDEALQIEEGALYPALHRLERRDSVESEWGLSENNRKAKYYRLTPRGRRELTQETFEWLRFAEAVAKVLNATAATRLAGAR